MGAFAAGLAGPSDATITASLATTFVAAEDLTTRHLIENADLWFSRITAVHPHQIGRTTLVHIEGEEPRRFRDSALVEVRLGR